MNQPIITSPNCPNCGEEMLLREKDGSKFWGCRNWKECGGKTIPYGVPRPKPQGFQKAVGGNEEVMDALRKVYQEIQELRKEFQDFTIIFSDKTKDE